MANFDEDIKRITNEILEDGTVEQLIREKITKGFSDAVDGLFRWGDLKSAVEKRVKEVLVPYIENYDMGRYIVKLDTVLTDIVNSTALADNAKILSNFQELMTEPDMETATLKDLFEHYKEYVANNMDTYGRDVTWDGGKPEYEYMSIGAEIVMEDERFWSSFEWGKIEFFTEEEEQQEELNVTVRLSRCKGEKKPGYEISYDTQFTVNGLRYLNDFEIYLLRLSRAGVRVLESPDAVDDIVTSTAEPEPTYE